MWEVLQTIPIDANLTQVILDNFHPEPGWDYTERYVTICKMDGMDIQSNVVEIRDHQTTHSMVIRLPSARIPPGSYIRMSFPGPRDH